MIWKRKPFRRMTCINQRTVARDAATPFWTHPFYSSKQGSELFQYHNRSGVHFLLSYSVPHRKHVCQIFWPALGRVLWMYMLVVLSVQAAQVWKKLMQNVDIMVCWLFKQGLHSSGTSSLTSKGGNSTDRLSILSMTCHFCNNYWRLKSVPTNILNHCRS